MVAKAIGGGRFARFLGPLAVLLGAAAVSRGPKLVELGGGKIPKGKGVWVHSVKHASSPEVMVEAMKSVGADYAIIATVWQKANGEELRYALDEIPAYAEALRKAGIDVWLWGWPDSEKSRMDSFIARVSDVWKKSKASGFVLDMEDQWLSKKYDPNARYIIKELQKVGPVGVTTYGGGPANVKSFPWKAVAEESDFGMPQIYTELSKYGVGYPGRAVKRYEEAGFKGVIPVLSASPGRDVNYMKQYQKHTPLPEGSVSYWHYYHMFRSGSSGRKRAEALASYDVGDYGSSLA